MEQLSLGASDSEAWAERFTASLHAERNRAVEFLAEQQQRLGRAEAFVAQELHRLEKELAAQADQAGADAATAEAGERVEDEELRNSYEQALCDLRHVRSQNAELQEQVARIRSPASNLAQQSPQSGRLDWEAEKQRILLALENDVDEGDETQQRERLKISDVLRTTEEAVASRDREIQALNDRLEKSLDIGGPNSTACATAEVIDNDVVVREERERLKQLQEQCSAKLREAEVELAVERAKLARQRAELEAQTRADAEATQTPAAAESSRHAATKHRGRWLARLGLTDADREPRRVVGP